jgi:haloalkane dehalogenase
VPAIDVLDSTIAHLDQGAGTPVVFLHGNPTSSYSWRKVLPRFDRPARLLAPDLIGMGRSGKPPSDYRFGDHARYLDAWFDALGLDDVLLVGHDWGAALALDHAARHPDRVRGVAFFETILRPMTWTDLPEGGRERFQRFRVPGVGEDLVLEQNVFIEGALRQTTVGGLSDEDIAAYAAPFPTAQSRRPILAWARSMPMDGEPADVTAIVEGYDKWLAATPEVPKLLLTFADHPSLMIGAAAERWCRENIAGLEVVACGAAGHIAQEDRPDEIAAALTAWTDRHGLLAP